MSLLNHKHENDNKARGFGNAKIGHFHLFYTRINIYKEMRHFLYKRSSNNNDNNNNRNLCLSILKLTFSDS